MGVLFLVSAKASGLLPVAGASQGANTVHVALVSPTPLAFLTHFDRMGMEFLTARSPSCHLQLLCLT